ncbi:restriction endonuclease subunit S [Nocardiopsis sp. NPDC049922]|uniref:restriction endonuclease subunit S n=1 Tax=Nocardiopsis sp. NPDC049922 TaxID=3155157 RepID=UPI00340E00C9
MSEWEWVPAGTAVTQRKDIVQLANDVEYRTMGVRWYGKGAYDRGVGTTKTIKAKRLYRASAGDFVFNRIDTHKGAFDVVPDRLDGALATNEFPLYRTNPARLMARFLLLYFQQETVLRTIENSRSGSEGRARWKEADFEGWKIPLPPIGEQRRILAVVDAVDRKVSSAEVEARQLDRVLAKIQAEIPDAPERYVGDLLFSIDSGKSVRALGDTPVIGKPRILKLSAIRPSSFDASEGKYIEDITPFSGSHVVQEGDLLITRSNTPDRVGYVAMARDVPRDTYMPDLMWRLRPDPEKVRVDYLEHVFASSRLRARVTATASGTSQSMRKINKAGFSKVLVPVPSLEDQKEYADQCAAVAASVKAIRTEIDRLRAVRSGLVNALLSREVQVDGALAEFVKEKGA